MPPVISGCLAVDGGQPVRSSPWLDNFTTGDEERRAVLEVLGSGYLSLFEGAHTPDPPFRFDGGPWVRRLESEVSDSLGGAHVISVNSATSGLYAAIGALGIGFGDEVIVSPYTMSACATAPLVYGAIPVFADVESATGSLSAAAIEARVSPRTRAVLVVHQFGIPADMDGIMAIAGRHGLKVIEDCAQAWGAQHCGRPVGTIGDIGVFSFNVNKTIQCGEGGLCVTSNDDLAYRLRLIRNHGEAVVGPAGYDDITNIIGFNYRLTEVQAAIALEQVRKLPDLNRRRLELVWRLNDGLAGCECLKPPDGRAGCLATYYVYPLRYAPEYLGGTSRKVFCDAVNAEGILFHQGYVRPLYLQPLYQRRQGFKQGYPWAAPENRASAADYTPGCCPNAEWLHFERMIINEHIRPPHDAADIDDVITAVHKVVAVLNARAQDAKGG